MKEKKKDEERERAERNLASSGALPRGGSLELWLCLVRAWQRPGCLPLREQSGLRLALRHGMAALQLQCNLCCAAAPAGTWLFQKLPVSIFEVNFVRKVKLNLCWEH